MRVAGATGEAVRPPTWPSASPPPPPALPPPPAAPPVTQGGSCIKTAPERAARFPQETGGRSGAEVSAGHDDGDFRAPAGRAPIAPPPGARGVPEDLNQPPRPRPEAPPPPPGG